MKWGLSRALGLVTSEVGAFITSKPEGQQEGMITRTLEGCVERDVW